MSVFAASVSGSFVCDGQTETYSFSQSDATSSKEALSLIAQQLNSAKNFSNEYLTKLIKEQEALNKEQEALNKEKTESTPATDNSSAKQPKSKKVKKNPKGPLKPAESAEPELPSEPSPAQ